MNGKFKEAERKAVETSFSNVYLFDKFFGRPIRQIDKLENSTIARPEFTEYFNYSSTQSELGAFSKWLMEFEQSEKFKSVTRRFIDAQIRLKDEHNPEKRQDLIRIDRQLLNEI